MKIATANERTEERRTLLTRERVLEAAVELADRDGIESVSMRKLGQQLGVEAMSLYTHVRGKDDLLDGMVEVVVSEIPINPGARKWKSSLRRTILSAREVLLRHPWAPRIIETRAQPGPAMLRYFDVVTGILRKAGFSTDLTHHTLHVLGSRVLGFTQDLYDDSERLSPEAAAIVAAGLAGQFPNIAQIVLAVSHEGGLGGCDDDLEFAFALDLILDGLERRRDA